MAIAAAGFFAALFAVYGASPASPAVPLLGALAHLALFPVVGALKAPAWARSAGYGWLTVDIVSNTIGLAGAPVAIATAVRLGGHLPAALWIGSVSWQQRGAPRRLAAAAGLPLAGLLATYSLVFPWAPEAMLFPAFLLIIAWFAIEGRMMWTAPGATAPVPPGGEMASGTSPQ